MRKTSKALSFCLALALLHTSIGFAADQLIDKTKLKRDKETVTAELWGEKLANDYFQNLSVIFKRDDKHVITAHKITINGGYAHILKPVQILEKDANEQLLVGMGQGTWTIPSEYRILDYDKKGKVTEIFGEKDSLGVIVKATGQDNKVKIDLKNGETHEVEIKRTLQDIEAKRINFEGIYSLTPYDADEDGVQELFLDQEITARRKLLVDVGYMLKYDKEKNTWNESLTTIMANNVAPAENTVNEGQLSTKGILTPRKIVIPIGEGTYPEFCLKNQEHNEKINALVSKEVEKIYPKVFDGKEDLAFNMLRWDDKLMCLQLISGKTDFKHHQININPKTMESVKLSSILNVKSKKLIQKLKELSEKAKANFEGVIPENWYIQKDELYLVQIDKDGKDRGIVFKLEDIKEFIIDKAWLPQVKDEKKDAKEKDAKDKEEDSKEKKSKKLKKDETPEEKFWRVITEAEKKDDEKDFKEEKTSDEDKPDKEAKSDKKDEEAKDSSLEKVEPKGEAKEEKTSDAAKSEKEVKPDQKVEESKVSSEKKVDPVAEVKEEQTPTKLKQSKAKAKVKKVKPNKKVKAKKAKATQKVEPKTEPEKKQ